MEHIIILVVLPAVVWLPKPMTAKDTMKKSDPLVASFCAICNAMCSRHKYCKLIKQAKSGDMQFMHVIIADHRHHTQDHFVQEKGRQLQARIQEFSSGVQTFVKFWKAKKKKKEERKQKKKKILWWFFPFCRLYDLNRLSRHLFTYKFITVEGMVFFCTTAIPSLQNTHLTW